MGRVRPLTSVTHMWVKAYVHRQNPAYTGQNLCTQSPKNRPVYARIDLRTRKCKLRIQARAYARRSTDRKCPFTFSSIYHPKSILNMFLPFLMCQVFFLNPSHNKTQVFTWPKPHQNGRSKRNMKMRKF